MSTRHLIIGAGVAGVAAAEAIRQQDSTAPITLIGNEPHRFYSRPGLAYYLTGELPEKQLFLSQAGTFETITAQVTAINPPQHEVQLKSGRCLPYDRLLLATGSQAARVSLPGAALDGVVKLDTLDDARHILQLAKKTRRAVVVGGGITALELVEGLRARGIHVTYLLRSNRYWRNVLDETESRVVEERLQHEGVELRFNTQLSQILGEGGRVTAVETGDGQQIKCQLVAVAVGVKPNLGPAQAAGLRIDRGILVNEYLQTSQPDIFAAGDVAQVFDPRTGSTVLDTLWPVARAQGQAAGQNMAGANTPYHRTVPLNVTRLAGLTTAIIGMVGQGEDADVAGIVRGDSETWRQLPNSTVAQNHFDVNHLRLVIGDKSLLGAVVMGDQTLTRPLYRLISAQADISAIKTQLQQANGHLANVIINFFTTWSAENETSQP